MKLLPVIQFIGILMTFSSVATPAFSGEDHSELVVPSAPIEGSKMSDFRILFVGNSITRHGFSPVTIEKMKWDHMSGMAATCEEKDYAHLLIASIQKSFPGRKVVTTFASLLPGGKGTSDERLAPVKSFASATCDLVIIQHGEHERADAGEAAVGETYEKLIAMFTGTPPPVLIGVGIWNPTAVDKASGRYVGFAKVVQEAMRKICEQHSAPFVSIEDLAADPSNRGWGEADGVRWHPNDLGHQRYAEKIFEAFRAEAVRRGWGLSPLQ